MSFFFPLSSFLFLLPKNHPDPSSPTKGHPCGGGEYPVVLRRWENDRTVVCLLSIVYCLLSFLFLLPKNHPDPSSPTKGHPCGGGEYPVVLRDGRITIEWSFFFPLFSFLFLLSSFFSRKTTPTLRLRQRATPPEEGNISLFLGDGEMIGR